MVPSNDLRMLVNAIEDYIKWARSTDEQGRVDFQIKLTDIF